MKHKVIFLIQLVLVRPAFLCGAFLFKIKFGDLKKIFYFRFYKRKRKAKIMEKIELNLRAVANLREQNLIASEFITADIDVPFWAFIRDRNLVVIDSLLNGINAVKPPTNADTLTNVMIAEQFERHHAIPQ